MTSDYNRQPGGFLPLACACGVSLAACLGAAAPWGLGHGLLFVAMGGLMVMFPPQIRRPGGWLVAASLWLLGSLGAFFPVGDAVSGPWREQLVAAGIAMPGTVSPQPLESAVVLAAMAAAGLGSLWVMGQWIDTRRKHRIAALWVAAVVLFTSLDVILRWLGEMPDHLPDCGFFPNRNHGADLVVSGTIVALGLFVHALRHRQVPGAILSGLAMVFTASCLLTRTSSRAGGILLAGGCAAWLLLVGPRYLAGNTGRAVALVFLAAVLIFVSAENTIKSRIGSTLDKIAESSQAGYGSTQATELDGRVGIARDTWRLVADQPWTGIGAGQFRYVFPQYRRFSAGTNGSDTLHPESSWLWIAAESGVPACLGLITLAGWVIIHAARDILKAESRLRILRAACLVAAAVPVVHGIFDVPIHRTGILWSASLLCLLALPSRERLARRWQRMAWRAAGVPVCALGAWLLIGQLLLQPRRPSENTALVIARGMEALRVDAKQSFYPQPNADPLENALKELDGPLAQTPLDARAHGLKAMLALHFDDKDATARRECAIHRALEPTWVHLPLLQAEAWSRIDPAETSTLWQETIHRARTMEHYLPGTSWREPAFRQILQRARKTPDLKNAAILAADGDTSLLKEIDANLRAH